MIPPPRRRKFELEMTVGAVLTGVAFALLYPVVAVIWFARDVAELVEVLT